MPYCILFVISLLLAQSNLDDIYYKHYCSTSKFECWPFLCKLCTFSNTHKTSVSLLFQTAIDAILRCACDSSYDFHKYNNTCGMYVRCLCKCMYVKCKCMVIKYHATEVHLFPGNRDTNASLFLQNRSKRQTVAVTY